MTVSFVHVSGLSGKQPRRNGNQQRKSREKVVALLPACSDDAMQIKSTWRGKLMKNHTRVSDYKSSGAELSALVDVHNKELAGMA